MPSARSILLQNSKNHLAILRLYCFTSKFTVKFVNFSFKFEYKKSRRRIFLSDEAVANEARERIYNT